MNLAARLLIEHSTFAQSGESDAPRPGKCPASAYHKPSDFASTIPHTHSYYKQAARTLVAALLAQRKMVARRSLLIPQLTASPFAQRGELLLAPRASLHVHSPQIQLLEEEFQITSTVKSQVRMSMHVLC